MIADLLYPTKRASRRPREGAAGGIMSRLIRAARALPLACALLSCALPAPTPPLLAPEILAATLSGRGATVLLHGFSINTDGWFFDREPLRRFAGTGVIIDASGTVITARHVVEGAFALAADLPAGEGGSTLCRRGRHVPMRIAALLAGTDLAILRPAPGASADFQPVHPRRDWLALPGRPSTSSARGAASAPPR
jgi:S1-C subfamily serine protease